jgi:hypothetical protein
MEQPDASSAVGSTPDVARVTAEIEANVIVRLGAAFWDWIDQRAIVRRVMTLGTFGVVVQTTMWAQHFVETTTKSDAGVALMLGAVTAPITALMGFMFSTYQQSKREI